MSKIKNGGLDQYGAGIFEQQQFGTAGVEGVKKQFQAQNREKLQKINMNRKLLLRKSNVVVVAGLLPLLSVINVDSFTTSLVVVVVTLILSVAGVTCRRTDKPAH